MKVLIGPAVLLALAGLGALSSFVFSPGHAPVASQSAEPISPDDPFWAARTLARLGLNKDSIDAATAARSAAPQASIPPELLSLGAPADDPFNRARSLAAAGFDAEARAALKKAAEERPGKSIPPELRYLSDRPIRDWQGADAWNSLAVILLNAAALAAAAIIAALALMLLTSIGRRVFETRLQVKDFDGESSLGLGRAVAVATEDELVQLRNEGGSSSFIFVRGPEPELKLPDPIKDVAPHVKLLAAIVDLIPSQVHVLSGTLLPRGERGVGLTVSLADPRGRVGASATLWEKDFDPSYTAPPADTEAKLDAARRGYMRLALAAASWALYKPPLDRGDRLRNGYQSDQWASYATHRVAASLQEDRHETRARASYVAALERDPQNTGALFNLAQIDGDSALDDDTFTDDDRALLERALSRAREARRVMVANDKHRPAAMVRRDRHAYRIRYGIARLAIHQVLHDPKLTSDQKIALLDHAETELAALLDLAREYNADRAVGTELDRFITRIESASVVMLCGAWTEFLRLGREVIPDDRKFPDGLAPNGKRIPTETIAARFKLDERTRLDRMTRYNLACYYAGVNTADSIESAFAELSFGLAAHRVEAARKDPSLKILKVSPHNTRFDALLALFGEKSSAAAGALGKVQRIGPFAAALAEREIRTVDELEPYAEDPALRRQLAKEIGATESLIESWGQILDLRKVRGIMLGLPEAELLYEAGLRSPSALRGLDGGKLAADIKALNTVRKLMDAPPAEELVASWIRAES